jgi:predicted AAA+ superfamily ATPase
MTDLDMVKARLDETERRVENLVEVCGAIADDTLRVCFVLDELHRAGQIPVLPWDVATAMVELHHAIQALKGGMDGEGGVDPKQRVEDLKAEVVKLREEYHKMVSGDA